MSTRDNFQLVSYLTAAEVFNKGQNIYECFLPIVESVLISIEAKNSIMFNNLLNEINNTYHIDMPKSTLKKLLDILQDQGKIKQNINKIIISSKEGISSEFWDTRVERESVISEFFLELNSYLINNEFDLPLQQIKSKCCNWLYSNSLKLASFINSGILSKEQNTLDETDLEFSNQLVDFLLEIKNRKSEYFNTFLLLYNGAVHTSLLNFEVEEIRDICDSSFQFKNIILDTNFILRMLGLQSEFDCTITEDTLNILKKNNAKFFILEQTIEEIQKSIKNYLFESEPYTIYTQVYFKNSKIRMNGFYEASKRGISRIEFLSFTRNDYIKSKICQLLDVTFVDNFDEKLISTEQIDNLIASKNRDNYGISQAQHDLCLIEYCKSRRSKNVSSIEDIDFWVLTNDERLTFWNQLNSGEFQECLTEIQLSNLMWIQKKRNDNSGLMQTILSLSNTNTLSLQSIERFANMVHAYQERNKDNISSLDKLSLVFASHALSMSDIKRINNEEDNLDNIVEAKVIKIRENESIQKQENEDLKEQENQLSKKNFELEKKLNILSTQMEIQNNENKISKYEKDVKDLEREKDTCLNKYEIYSDIDNYKNKHEKFIARLVCLFITFPIILLLICYVIFGYGRINILLEKIDKMPSFTQNIISDILIPALFIGLYYFVITIIFSTPLSPKELFNTLRNNFLNYICKKYLIQKGVSVNYINNDIKQKIIEYNNNIIRLNDEIENLKTNISTLTAENNILNKMLCSY